MTKKIHIKKASEIITISIFFIIYLVAVGFFSTFSKIELNIIVLTISTLFFSAFVIVLSLFNFSRETRFLFSIFILIAFGFKSTLALYLFVKNPLYDLNKVLISILSLFLLSIFNLIISLIMIPSEK